MCSARLSWSTSLTCGSSWRWSWARTSCGGWTASPGTRSGGAPADSQAQALCRVSRGGSSPPLRPPFRLERRATRRRTRSASARSAPSSTPTRIIKAWSSSSRQPRHRSKRPSAPTCAALLRRAWAWSRNRPACRPRVPPARSGRAASGDRPGNPRSGRRGNRHRCRARQGSRGALVIDPAGRSRRLRRDPVMRRRDDHRIAGAAAQFLGVCAAAAGCRRAW